MANRFKVARKQVYEQNKRFYEQNLEKQYQAEWQTEQAVNEKAGQEYADYMLSGLKEQEIENFSRNQRKSFAMNKRHSEEVTAWSNLGKTQEELSQRLDSEAEAWQKFGTKYEDRTIEKYNRNLEEIRKNNEAFAQKQNQNIWDERLRQLKKQQADYDIDPDVGSSEDIDPKVLKEHQKKVAQERAKLFQQEYETKKQEERNKYFEMQGFTDQMQSVESIADSIQQKMKAGTLSGDRQHVAQDVLNNIENFKIDFGIAKGNAEKMRQVLKDYGLEGGGKIGNVFKEQMNRESTATDYIMGYKMPQLAAGGFVLAGAVSSVFSNKGRMPNSQLYAPY